MLLLVLFERINYSNTFLSSKLYLNIYTAPAFVSAITGGINLVLFLVAFKDVRVVSTAKRNSHGSSSNQSNYY
jgi:hypothetical protein